MLQGCSYKVTHVYSVGLSSNFYFSHMQENETVTNLHLHQAAPICIQDHYPSNFLSTRISKNIPLLQMFQA